MRLNLEFVTYAMELAITSAQHKNVEFVNFEYEQRKDNEDFYVLHGVGYTMPCGKLARISKEEFEQAMFYNWTETEFGVIGIILYRDALKKQDCAALAVNHCAKILSYVFANKLKEQDMSDIRFRYKTAVVLRSGDVFSKGEVVAIEVVQADNSQGFVYRCTKDGKCDLINQQLLHRYVL